MRKRNEMNLQTIVTKSNTYQVPEAPSYTSTSAQMSPRSSALKAFLTQTMSRCVKMPKPVQTTKKLRRVIDSSYKPVGGVESQEKDQKEEQDLLVEPEDKKEEKGKRKLDLTRGEIL